MKSFEIKDAELKVSVGVLLYYEKSASFIIELADGLDEWTAPLMFTSFVKKGIFTIPRDISFLWGKERIIPSGRQNIGAILNSHHLEQYDEMKFLEISKGRCSQDSLFIKAIKILPDYIRERQRKNLLEVSLLDSDRLLCFFADDKVKVVDLNQIRDVADADKIIRNKALYQSGKVGAGGYAVTFNDSIDIPARRLYEAGTDIPLTLNDFKRFVRYNVMGTGESCELLSCSRQNLSYMVKQKQLEPVKVLEKGNLYLKGELEKAGW